MNTISAIEFLMMPHNALLASACLITGFLYLKGQSSSRGLDVQAFNNLTNQHKLKPFELDTKQTVKLPQSIVITQENYLEIIEKNYKPSKNENEKLKPVLLVCHNGQLSAKIAKQLVKKGYKQTYYLHNGIKAWVDAFLPTKKV